MNKALIVSTIICCVSYTSFACSKEVTPDEFIYSIDRKISSHKIDLSSKKDLATIFEPTLSTQIYKDAQLDNPSDSDQKIDFNVFYGGQDTEVSHFKVKSTTGDEKKYKVNVTFDNLKLPQSVTYTVIPTPNSGYKIYDIEYKSNFTLRKIFSK